jgi:hypothetical protein
MNANKSNGQVLFERLRKFARIIKIAERLDFAEEIHHRVYELLELAGILHREKQLSDEEFKQIWAAWKAFEESFSAIDFYFEATTPQEVGV